MSKGFTHDWQGTPYAGHQCPACGSRLLGPASRLPWLTRQHQLRCDEATQAERAARLATGRWPRRPPTPASAPPRLPAR